MSCRECVFNSANGDGCEALAKVIRYNCPFRKTKRELIRDQIRAGERLERLVRTGQLDPDKLENMRDQVYQAINFAKKG